MHCLRMSLFCAMPPSAALDDLSLGIEVPFSFVCLGGVPRVHPALRCLQPQQQRVLSLVTLCPFLLRLLVLLTPQTGRSGLFGAYGVIPHH